MTNDPQFPHYIQDPELPDYKFGLDKGLRFKANQPDNPKGNATHSATKGVRFAHPSHAKPLMKLMTRALQGRRGKSLFNNKPKRKKVRVV